MLNLVRETVEGIRRRSRHKSFVDAAMAACAMVALADDEQRLSELITRDRVLVRIDELRSIDHQQAVALYDNYAEAIRRDPGRGREQALAAIGAFANDLEGADLLVYVLDGAAGVRPADYRWVGRLRRLSMPLLVVLNKTMGDSTSLMMVLLLRFKRLLVVFLKMRACQGEVGKISEISPLPDPQLHSTYYVGKKASILK